MNVTKANTWLRSQCMYRTVEWCFAGCWGFLPRMATTLQVFGRSTHTTRDNVLWKLCVECVTSCHSVAISMAGIEAGIWALQIFVLLVCMLRF